MDADQAKKLVKKGLMMASFFVLALVLFLTGQRFMLVVYVCVVGVLMVCAILLQAGRGGGLASLGGLSGDNLLGARSATPIAKVTYVMAALFLFACVLTAKMEVPKQEVEGVIDGGAQQQPAEPGPALPEELPTGPDAGQPEPPANAPAP